MTGLGAAVSVFFSALGSSIASAPAGIYAISSSSGIKAFCPIVISGVLAIYGIIVAVILCGKLSNNEVHDETDGYRHFSAGLAVGLACLASGCGLARFLEANLRISAPVPRGESDERFLLGNTTSVQTRVIGPAEINIKFIMVLCFIEAIGLYGLIVGLLLSN